MPSTMMLIVSFFLFFLWIQFDFLFLFCRFIPLDDEDCEPFTDVYWIKFHQVNNARCVKQFNFLFHCNRLSIRWNVRILHQNIVLDLQKGSWMNQCLLEIGFKSHMHLNMRTLVTQKRSWKVEEQKL